MIVIFPLSTTSIYVHYMIIYVRIYTYVISLTTSETYYVTPQEFNYIATCMHVKQVDILISKNHAGTINIILCIINIYSITMQYQTELNIIILMVEPCSISDIIITKQFEYATKDHIAMDTISFKLYSLAPYGIYALYY